MNWRSLIALCLLAGTALAEPAKTQRLTFAIEARGQWSDRANAALRQTDGVVKSDLLARDRQIRVEYQPDRTTPQKLARALAGAGLTARLLLRVGGMS